METHAGSGGFVLFLFSRTSHLAGLSFSMACAADQYKRGQISPAIPSARCRLLISSPRPEEQGRRVELRRSKLVAAAGSTDAIVGIYSAG